MEDRGVVQAPFLEGKSIISKGLIFSGVLAVSFSALSLLSILLLPILFGISPFALSEMGNNLNDPNFVHALEFLQIAQAVGLFIIPALLYSWLAERNPYSYVKLNKKTDLLSLFLVGAVMLFAQPLIGFLADFNARMSLPESMHSIELWMKNSEESATKLTEAFLKMNTLIEFVFAFFMIAILSPIGEELLFRGLLQRMFTRLFRNPHLAIFVSAFLFSAIHMQFFGFIPRLILGLLLGYLYFYSGSLWLSIMAHFANNGLAVIFAFLENHGLIPIKTEELEDLAKNNLVVLVSFMAVSGLLYYVFKTLRNQQAIPA